jgi:hypothetical protein
MEYSQEDLNKVLNKLNSGTIGKRKQGTWDTMVKKTKFTKQLVIEEAKKYKYYHDFKTERSGEFQYAEKYGFLDKLNLERKFNTDRDFESIKEIAKNYNNRYAFQLGSAEDYYKAKREGWLDEICSHMLKPMESNIKWTDEKFIEKVNSYGSLRELRELNSYVYKMIHKRKLLGRTKFAC